MEFYKNYNNENIIIDFVKKVISIKSNCFLEDDKTIRLWVEEWTNNKNNNNSFDYSNIFYLSKLLQEDKETVSDFIEFYKKKKIQKIINNAIGKNIKINGKNKTITDINIQNDKDKIDIHFQDNQIISISDITELEKVLIINKKIYQKGDSNV